MEKKKNRKLKNWENRKNRNIFGRK
jgi:hypothetical protein